MFAAFDTPPPTLPLQGISLHDCLTNLPYMGDILSRLNSRLDMVRGVCTSDFDEDTEKYTATAIIHPSNADLLDRFGELVKGPPDSVNSLAFVDVPSGYIIKMDLGPDRTLLSSWPHATCLDDESVYFSCNTLNLGEFGCLYVALHICGNFARYYPDIWLRHIEKCSPLAMAIDELCVHAFDRLPLLSLSELHRRYYVIEA